MNISTFNDLETFSSQDLGKPEMGINNLTQAQEKQEYIIKDILPEDEEMTHFLFSLGCFKGESITLVSIISDSYVIIVKDARYSIGSDLAELILI
ncbi:FeoA family protein [Psychromonas sp. KJ10-10]|uniref:FeoA family protein n=1 Tax=Psychromonas sp. KJ10-10 TaxID=3391823 RepID=UPI0039B56DF9